MSALSPFLRDAEGGILMFWCPGCETCHGVRVAAAGVPHPCWTWNGDAHRPTFQPSILVNWFKLSDEGLAMIQRKQPPPAGTDRYPGTDEVCHSFVTDGQIQFLGDCTHKLAGQTVPLPAWANGALEVSKTPRKKRRQSKAKRRR